MANPQKQSDEKHYGWAIDLLAALYMLNSGLGFLFCFVIYQDTITFVAILICGFSLLGIAIGIGISLRTKWARTAALVAAIPLFCEFPLGTGIAILSLFLLMDETHYKSLPKSDRGDQSG